MMDDDQQFCLRWNNHQSTLVSVFDTLLEKGIHVDCTLAAEGQTLKAHKVVLSACSPYFESVLSQQYDKHPIIILKDVKYAELRAMMDYMYRGEVNISQDQLAALLKAAESLQIKGLSDNKPSRPPSRPAAVSAAAAGGAVPPPVSAAAPPLAIPTHPTLPSLPAIPAHPPRVASPPPQGRDGSVDSRSGSVSPSRRRKKARRASDCGPGGTNVPGIPGTGIGTGTPCDTDALKDELDDLTADDDPDDDGHKVTHNDVVRNFQWHMERSQDELMNSNDSVRDSQGTRATRQSIVTRSKKMTEETEKAEKVTTLAVLKTVRTSKLLAQTKPPAAAPPTPAPPAPTPAKATSTPPAPVDLKENVKATSTPVNPAAPIDLHRDRYDILSGRRRNPPCAQYKTDKGYKCPNCQRQYNARRNLVRHVTLECGIEPQFKCPFCSYRKHRRNEVKKHIERKHPDQCADAAATPSPAPAPSPTTPPTPAPLAVK